MVNYAKKNLQDSVANLEMKFLSRFKYVFVFRKLLEQPFQIAHKETCQVVNLPQGGKYRKQARLFCSICRRWDFVLIGRHRIVFCFLFGSSL